MIDASFFDANGEVKPERLDEFVTHIRALVARYASRGGHITLTASAMNAVAAQIARKRAEAKG
jgi:hypothetical protein